MSKVFRRPMFRRGGSTGGVKTMDGIMHGIQTRSMNNLGGTPRRNFYGGSPEDIQDIKSQMSMIDAISGPAPDHLAQLMIKGGLNLVSGVGAGTGSKLGDIAAAYKGPTDQAFKAMATDRSGNKVLAATLLKGLGASDMDKVIRSGKQIAKQFNLSEKEGIKIAFNQKFHKDDLSPEAIARNEFESRAKALYQEKDNRNRILIVPDGARKTIRALDKLREDYPAIAKSVFPSEPYLQDRIKKGSKPDGKGNLVPDEKVIIKLNPGQVYYDYIDGIWYSFDGKLLTPAIPAE
jgi:hypothetical protein